MQLSPAHQALHQRALELSADHRRIEATLIAVLKEIDKSKLFKKLGQSSLFTYAVNLLGLSESIAYAFISVARKSEEIEPLLTAIQEQSLSVAKASRIVSALTKVNAPQLIEFAKTHSTRVTEFEVARLRPKSASPDRVKPLAENLIELKVSVSKEIYVNLKRAQALVASATGKEAGLEGVLDAVLTEYLQRRDPVKRAERALARKVAKPAIGELCARRVLDRRPLTVAQKHVVVHRDGGRCTHVDASKRRCETDRWLHIHHVTPVSQGGSNDPENLVTLCSYHHDLAHQLSMPLEGQVTWLRAREARYGA